MGAGPGEAFRVVAVDGELGDPLFQQHVGVQG